ncbi:tyrosine--tRNA ligase, partial [Candidatus Saccharibacteria bacterium]|nr:tyrosine--tRNA ligase [Candidatus Saccharibacteria bacterium]
VLAYEVTKLVHGKDNAETAKKVSAVLFGGEDFLQLSEQAKNMLAKELPTGNAQNNLAATLVHVGLATSNTEANRFISSGAISVNGQKVENADAGLVKGKNLLKRGKNNFAVVEG